MARTAARAVKFDQIITTLCIGCQSAACHSIPWHGCKRHSILRLPTCLQDSESELDLRFKALSRAEPADQPQQPQSPTSSAAPQVEAAAAGPESSEGMQPLSPDSEASGLALQRTANTPAAAAELPRVRTLSDIFYTSEDLDAEEMPAKYASSEGAAEGAEALRSVPSAQEAQAGVSSRLAVQVRVWCMLSISLAEKRCSCSLYRASAGRRVQPPGCTGERNAWHAFDRQGGVAAASLQKKRRQARPACQLHMWVPQICNLMLPGRLQLYFCVAHGNDHVAWPGRCQPLEKPRSWALQDVLVALLPPGLALVHAMEASAQSCATVQENGAGLLGGAGRPSAANGGNELAAASGVSPDAVLGREGGNPKHQAAPPVGPGQMGSSPQVGETFAHG